MSAKWDVVVIGGGAAGLTAGRVAAEEGARTIILEHHTAIGLPRHCTGWLLGSRFTQNLLKRLTPSIIAQEVKYFSLHFGAKCEPLGRIDNTGWGGYFVDRPSFDRELARLAVDAGAQLRLNAFVTELLRNGSGAVVGVRLKDGEEVGAAIVVCADGLHSLKTGFARRELTGNKDEPYMSGVNVFLGGLEGLEPGGIERFEAVGAGMGLCSLYPHQNNTAFAAFVSLDDFEKMKSAGHLLSRRIKNAQPLSYFAFSDRHARGVPLDRASANGILFVGEAAGYHGTIYVMISGVYGGRVAAAAAKEGDTSALKLAEYEDIRKASRIGRVTLAVPRHPGDLSKLSEAELRRFYQEKLEKYRESFEEQAELDV